jgi:hypothetical protein
MQAFRPITILLSAMKQMMGELFSFALILSIVFLGFGTAKFVSPHYSARKQGYMRILLTEFWAAISGDREEVDDDVVPILSSILSPLFAILVNLILMNMLMTMVKDKLFLPLKFKI